VEERKKERKKERKRKKEIHLPTLYSRARAGFEMQDFDFKRSTKQSHLSTQASHQATHNYHQIDRQYRIPMDND
jgi:hypothetical protein